MRIAKYQAEGAGIPLVGVVEDDLVYRIGSGTGFLSELLADEDVEGRVAKLRAEATQSEPLSSVQLLAPLDAQEVWGAGVTYERSKVARQEESEQGGSFYDLVYRAPRPELFFKATP
ncbi:fumarylacetoacetate hydrolase family protein, partial [Singulisphaera rosea]